jgi:hypothetical protein
MHVHQFEGRHACYNANDRFGKSFTSVNDKVDVHHTEKVTFYFTDGNKAEVPLLNSSTVNTL